MKPTTREAYQFFHEATLALSKVESAGIRIDTKYLDKTIQDTEKEISNKTEKLKLTKVYKKWKKRFGDKANIDSTAQLGAVLFEELGYEPKALTRTGKPKTDENSIRSIDDPFVDEYFQIKKLKKVAGTYLKGIRREVCDGFLHAGFNLAGGQTDEKKGGASSYRGSSSDPNFQNIPIRNKEMSKIIRQAFIARDEHHLVEIDFSGIEVKIAACYNKDPNLIRYIKDSSTDMHRDTASDLFGVSVSDMIKHSDVYKKTLRDASKNMFVFPQFYGSVWFQCAPPIWEAMEKRQFIIAKTNESLRDYLKKQGITKLGECDPTSKHFTKEPARNTFAYRVQQVEKSFWNDRFKVYSKWKRNFYQDYLNKGYFDLYTGFRCQGHFRRNQVINFPVQGSAFHCLLWCIIQIQKRLKGMKSKIVGQIHDSIILDVHARELQEVLHIAREVMTVRLRRAWKWIIVPIETEVDVCDLESNWHLKKPYKLQDGDWVLAN